eukprot:3472386-Amphidinium_carterae.1
MSVQEPDDVQEKMQSFRVRRDDEKKAHSACGLEALTFGTVNATLQYAGQTHPRSRDFVEPDVVRGSDVCSWS